MEDFELGLTAVGLQLKEANVFKRRLTASLRTHLAVKNDSKLRKFFVYTYSGSNPSAHESLVLTADGTHYTTLELHITRTLADGLLHVRPRAQKIIPAISKLQFKGSFFDDLNLSFFL
jgi:hypothetical protein